MGDDKRYLILSLLKAEFPSFEKKLEQIYWQDPLFRQIAREYQECISKQKVENGKSDDPYDLYADTIRELKEELLEHLNEPSGLTKIL